MAADFTQLQQAIRLLNAHTRAADEQAWQVLFDRWLATLSSETRRQMQTVRFNHAQLTLLTTLDQSSRKQLRNQDLNRCCSVLTRPSLTLCCSPCSIKLADKIILARQSQGLHCCTNSAWSTSRCLTSANASSHKCSTRLCTSYP